MKNQFINLLTISYIVAVASVIHAEQTTLDTSSPYESNNRAIFFLNSGFMQFSSADSWEFLYGVRQKFDDSKTICRVWSSFAADQLYCYVFTSEQNKNYMYACDYSKKKGRTEMTITNRIELKNDSLVNGFLKETKIPIDFHDNFKSLNPAWKHLIEKTSGEYQWAIRALSFAKPATMLNFDKLINEAWEISKAEREIARKSPFVPMAHK